MDSHNNTHVIVGLSGGVDSSVTAHLLKESGYQVSGIFMKNWVDVHGDGHCPIAEDLSDAEAIATHLDIPFSSINFAPEYWDRVFEHFLAELKLGRTPNPDILCNKEVKFNLFLHHALEQGSDYIATGHYARIREKDGQYHLLKGKDENKDQSYFLYTLQQAQLSKSLFPLGELDKSHVREIASSAGLITHNKKDSTGICFIGERNFTDFLSNYLPAQPGNMVTDNGEVVAEHNGLMFYTLGQRKGLKIGGRTDSQEQPWFVVGKRLQQNELVIAQGHDHPLLHSRSLTATNLSWTVTKPESGFRCKAKTRYRQEDQDCVITYADENPFISVCFDSPQRAVTPGQSIVFYQGDECIGGGIIDTVDGIIYE